MWLRSVGICRTLSITILSILFLLCEAEAPLVAQTFNKEQIETLEKIIPLVCGNFEQSGKNKTISIDTNAKAELSSLFKKLADLGIQGAGKINIDEYSGVLRTEIAPQLNNVRECRLKVWTDLVSRVSPAKSGQNGVSDHLKSVKINTTTISSFISKVGEPTLSSNFVSRFDFSDYVIFVYFNSGEAEDKNYLPKVIRGIAFVGSVDSDATFEIDGAWNKPPYCRARDQTDDCKQFVSPTGLGSLTVKDYILRKDSCEIEWTKRSGDMSPYFTISCGSFTNSNITLYISADDRELTAAGVNYDEVYETFVKEKYEPEQKQPNGVFAPPRPPKLKDLEDIRKEFKIIEKAIPTRLEIADYRLPEAWDKIDENYYYFHHSQNNPRN